MRGNSGFLRWMPSFARSSAAFGRYTVLVVVTLALLFQSSYAGPINTRHRRMMREVYTDFDAKNQTDVVQPEGTCILDGQQVPENTVHCEKKPGCRVIQKPDYCCPDYQCECERDGKTYSNGEKLVDPNTPCKVCHCQGGEFFCSTVNCYKRSDCEPKYITGRCCPEYDNCPPLENVKQTVNNETSTEAAPQSTPNGSTSSQEHVSSPSPTKPDLPTNSNSNNHPGYKIKEITKPEEIRIIDDKTKPVFPPMNKPLNNSNTNQVKASASKENSEPQNSIENGNHHRQNELPTGLSPSPSPPSETKTNNEATSSAETVNKLEMADVNAVNDEDSQKTVRHTDALANKNESSGEVPEEVSGEDKKAAASQMGKEVVIVDSNGNSQPITVFGVEGLQRGDVQADGPYENNSTTSSEKEDDKKTVDDLDLAASSTDDIRVLPLNPQPERTTEGLAIDSSHVFDTVLYTAGPELLPEDTLNLTGIVFDTVLRDNGEDIGPINVSTEGPRIHNNSNRHPHIEDYDSTSNEPNPAYPTIEDDLSNYGRDDINPPLVDDYPEGSHKGKSAEQPDERHIAVELKISTEGLDGSLIPISSSTSMIKSESTTEGLAITNFIDASLKTIKSKAAPGEPLLIPEWERTSSTEAIEDYLDGSHGGKLEEQAEESQVYTKVKISTTNSMKTESTTEGQSSTNSTEHKSKSAAPGEPVLIPEWERNSTAQLDLNQTQVPDMREDSLEIGSGSGSGFSPIKLEFTDTSLKRSSVIDDLEDFVGGSSSSLEYLADDSNVGAESITYNEGAEAAPGANSPFSKSLQNVLETMQTFQKGYLSIF